MKYDYIRFKCIIIHVVSHKYDKNTNTLAVFHLFSVFPMIIIIRYPFTFYSKPKLFFNSIALNLFDKINNIAQNNHCLSILIRRYAFFLNKL